MSHIARIKTRMVQKTYILAAIKDLGYTAVEKGKIRTFGLIRTPVDIQVSTGKGGYDIGLKKQDDGYEIVADWWGVKGVGQVDFTKKVAQRYAYHAAMAKLEEQGFSLVSEDVDSDKRIRLVLRRTA